MRTSIARCSRYENQVSIAPLVINATATTAANNVTYLRNNRPRGPDLRRLSELSPISRKVHSSTSSAPIVQEAALRFD